MVYSDVVVEVVRLGLLHFDTHAHELEFMIGWSCLDIKTTNILSSLSGNLASLESLHMMHPPLNRFVRR